MVEGTLKSHSPSRDDSFATVVGMFNAVERGDARLVRKYLEARPDLVDMEYPGIRKDTYRTRKPVHVAAQMGYTDVVCVLMEAGADPIADFRPFRHVPCAATRALENGHTETVEAIKTYIRQRIIDNVDYPSGIDENGNTVLHRVVYHGLDSLIDDLVEQGSDIDLTNNHGQRPIHIALYNDWEKPANEAVATALLDRGAKMDLWVASAMGDLIAVRQLLIDQPDSVNVPAAFVSWPGGVGYPLSIAALRGHKYVVDTLLEAGAHPDAPNTTRSGFQETGAPMVLALKARRFDVVHRLLDHGADANAPNLEAGPSSMDEAMDSGNEEIRNRLTIAGGRPTLPMYVRMHDYLTIGELLDRCPEVSGWSTDRTVAETFLMAGARLGEPNVLRMCLQRKPVVSNMASMELIGSIFATHNMVGEWSDYLEVVRLLMDFGIDTDPDATTWETLNLPHIPNQSHPLHWLCVARGCIQDNESRMIEMAGMLLDHGAELNTRDGEMNVTPLGWAARYGRRKYVEFLLSRGAAVNHPDDRPGTPPLFLADEQGYQDIVTLLTFYGAKV